MIHERILRISKEFQKNYKRITKELQKNFKRISIIQSFNHSIIQSFNHSIIQSFNLKNQTNPCQHTSTSFKSTADKSPMKNTLAGEKASTPKECWASSIVLLIISNLLYLLQPDLQRRSIRGLRTRIQKHSFI